MTAISKDSVISDIIRDYPECMEVFDRHSAPCRACMGALTCTVEEGAIMHDVDLGLLLSELSACAKNE